MIARLQFARPLTHLADHQLATLEAIIARLPRNVLIDLDALADEVARMPQGAEGRAGILTRKDRHGADGGRLYELILQEPTSEAAAERWEGEWRRAGRLMARGVSSISAWELIRQGCFAPLEVTTPQERAQRPTGRVRNKEDIHG